MSGAGVLLTLESNRWQVARAAGEQLELRQVSLAEGQDPLAAADGLVAALGEWHTRSVVLGVPSAMVLAAQVDSGNLPRRDRRTAMLYRLEEQLPIEAERLTADFVPAGAGRLLGLAVVSDDVRAIVERLAEAGIEVPGICPTALLALWEFLRRRQGRFDYAFLCWPERTDAFRMAGRSPAAWVTLTPEAADVASWLATEMLAGPAELADPSGAVVGPMDAGAVAATESQAALKLHRTTEHEPLALAARAARRLLAGEPAGWVNLRRDALAEPNPWGRLVRAGWAAVVLTLCLLAALAGTFHYRSLRYDALARRTEARQTAAFHRVFPDRRVPVNVKSRLRSELALLSGVSGCGFDLPTQPVALETLRRIAGGLPATVRLRIVEMRIDPSGIVIEGQARNHSDAEIVARSLKHGGFAVESPRTERLVRGGVAFTLVARPDRAPTLTAKSPGGDR